MSERWKSHAVTRTPARARAVAPHAFLALLVLGVLIGSLAGLAYLRIQDGAGSPATARVVLASAPSPESSGSLSGDSSGALDPTPLTVILDVSSPEELLSRIQADSSFLRENTISVRTLGDAEGVRTRIRSSSNPTGAIQLSKAIVFASNQVVIRDTANVLIGIDSFSSTPLSSARFQSTEEGIEARQLLNREWGGVSIMKVPAVRGSIDPRLYVLTLAEGIDPLEIVNSSRAREAGLVVTLNTLHFLDFIPNDTYFNRLYGLNNTGQNNGTPDADIDAVEAWDMETGDAGVIIADIDTGVWYDHPDLQSNMWRNPGEIPANGIDDEGNGFVDDYWGWDFGYNDSDPRDIFGHGTHTTGTIAGQGNNAVGVSGVCPACKVMALQSFVMGAFGPGAYASDLVAAINYSVSMGARVTSNSWGGSYDSLIDTAFAQADAQGVLNIAAAGNSGGYSLDYPGALPQMISVAATNNRDQPAPFSSYNNEVDVSAPGVSIYSTVYPLAPIYLAGCTDFLTDTYYAMCSGTSMATPHVAGLAGLLLSRNGFLTVPQLKSIIRSAVDSIVDVPIGTYYGTGRVNARAALGFVDPDGQPDLPTAILNHEVALSPVNGLVEIYGTASAPYVLEYGVGPYPSQWTTLSTGPGPITNGLLTTLDTRTIPDGTSTVRLRVTQNNQTTSDLLFLTIDNLAITYPVVMSDDPTFGNYEIAPFGPPLTILGRVNAPGFQRYEMTWAADDGVSGPYYATGVTLTNGGTQPIAGGAIAILDTSVIQAAYPGERTRKIMVNVTVYSANGPPVEEKVALVLDADFKWQKFLEIEEANLVQLTISPSEPTVADLDNDGKNESCLAVKNRVYCVDAHGNMKPGFPVNLPFGSQGFVENYEYSLTPFTISDVDEDGVNDLLLAGKGYNTPANYYVYAIKGDGTFVNGTPILLHSPSANTGGSRLATSIVAAQLIPGGEMEYILQNSTFFFVFRRDGVLLNPNATLLSQNGGSRAIGSYFWTWESTPAVGQFDADPDLEIVTLAQLELETSGGWGLLSVVNPDGSVLPGWPRSLTSPSKEALVVADLDYDGKDEIIVGVGLEGPLSYSEQGEVLAFDRRGEIIFRYPGSVSDYPVESNLAIADLDSDGTPEMIFSNYTSGDYRYQLRAINSRGEPHPAWTVPPMSDYAFAPHVYSFQNPIGKVVATNAYASNSSSTQERLRTAHFVSSTGDSVSSLPSRYIQQSSSLAAGIVNDLEGDGDLELIVGGMYPSSSFFFPHPNVASMVAYDLPASLQWQGNSDWPVYQHDTQRTGRYVNTTPIGAPAPVSGLVATHGAFAGRIHISWDNASFSPLFTLYRSTSPVPCPAGAYIQEFDRAPSGEKVVVIQTTGDHGLVENQSYYFSVRTSNASGSTCSPTSVVGMALPADTLPPSTPTGVVATDGTYSNRVIVNWNPSSGATSYTVYRHTQNNSALAVVDGTIAQPPYTDMPVQSIPNGPRYFYWVNASNASGTSGFSNGDQGWAGPQTNNPTLVPPYPPTALTASTGLTNKVTLNWALDLSGGTVTGVHVYRSTTSPVPTTTPYQTLGAVTTYDDTSVTPGTTYYYKVDAFNGGGNSPASNEASGSAASGGSAPNAPGNVSAGDGSLPSSVRVTWSASSGAISYDVYRNTTNSSSTSTRIAQGVTALAHNDPSSGITAGQSYYYWVTAVNASGSSPFSNGDSGYVLAWPTSLSASTASSSSILVNWSNPSNPAGSVQGINVYYSTSNTACTGTLVSLSTVTSTTLSGLAGNTTYYVSALTRGVNGNSQCSNVASATTSSAPTPPSAPTNLVASDGTYTNRVALSWNASSGATSYKAYRNTVNNSSTATLLQGGIIGLTYDDTAVTQGTTYYYWVKATNGVGDSGFSTSDAGYAGTGGSLNCDVPGSVNMGAYCEVTIALGGVNDDGELYRSGSSGGGWAAVRDATSAQTIQYSSDDHGVFSENDGLNYIARRYVASFALPSQFEGNTILGGSFRVRSRFGSTSQLPSPHTIHLLKLASISSNIPVTSDYGQCVRTPETGEIAASMPISSFVGGQDVTYSLNTTGAAYLQSRIGQYVKFCLVESRSMAGAAFPSQAGASNSVRIDSYVTGSSTNPVLIVRYT